MKNISLLLSACLFVGCASTHPGIDATPLTKNPNLKMRVSSNVINEYSDKYNIFIDLTFENLGGNWLHIDETELDFANSGDVAHNIIVGKDLYAWAESFEERKKIENYNASLAINTLIIAGAVAAVGSKNSTTSNVGAVAMTGGLAWDATRTIVDIRNKAQRGQSVPEKHVYRPFTVPAGGLIRRWVLINVPGNQVVKTFKLKLRTAEGADAEYSIPIQL